MAYCCTSSCSPHPKTLPKFFPSTLVKKRFACLQLNHHHTQSWPQHSSRFRISSQTLATPSASSTISISNKQYPFLEVEDAEKEGRTEEAVEKKPASAHLNLLVFQLSKEATTSSVSRALAIVRKLQDEDKLSSLNSNSLGHLAMAAAKTGSPRYGETIIRLMLQLGFLPHVKAWSGVVSRLGKYPQDFDLAFHLFCDICERVVEIEKMGLTKSIMLAHTRPDTGAFNAILNACAIDGNMVRAEELQKKMDLFGVRPDVLTFNIMIKLYGKLERQDLLVGVVEKMLEKNIEPCNYTFYSLVAAYVGFGDLKGAEKLVQAMREGRRDICNVLRQNSGQAGPCSEMAGHRNRDAGPTDSEKHVSASRLLLRRSYRPDASIYATLMKGYMQNRRLRDVIKMLRAMRNDDDPDSHPNEVIYTTAISAFAKMGSMDEAHAVLQEMAAKKVPANVVTYNSMLNGYCRLLEMQKAKDLMLEMKEAGVVPDVVSYNTMINGCIRINDSLGALTYFNEMREAGIAPSRISYTTLMKAFGMNGQPTLAAKVFEEMQKNPGIRVDVVAWNMLIESYSRAGMIERAKKVFGEMKEHGLHPTVATYGSLVNAFDLAKKPLEARVIWEEIKQRITAKSMEGGTETLVPDEGLLDSLVEIFVRAALFKKALEVLACMEELKIPANKRKYKQLFVELHPKIYTSKHASRARQDRRAAKKQAAEAFKFWVGLRNEYHES